ncbi:sugar kinase [Vibrio breoganii]|uniref:ROK family protein n=1 Tax=Vibrio breoganii TaxID=553239 RepID=UPI000C82CFF8|nr:ROK family protein [Vibrio breoganii]PML10602.1 sugar kinase [Vibrio breoganii]
MLLGLDIGGTKIEGVIVSPSNNNVVHRLRKPTVKSNYQGFFTSVRLVIDELLSRESIQSIGVGSPGSINRQTGLMQGANIVCLNGEDFLSDLKAAYPHIPIALTNDANCLAISEYETGAAKQASNSCLAVILGTGCGGGVIINGSIVDGQHGLGGEIGHNPLPYFSEDVDGPATQCYCGAWNCNELFLSGTGFERTWALKHSPLSAPDIFAKAHLGEQSCIQHIEHYCDQLARALGTIVNIIDPEVIVLGGGMSNQDVLYPIIQARLAQYTFGGKASTPIVKAMHGDSSGVLGAAYLPVMLGVTNLNS